MTIAWISSDIAYHPVARFIYGWFSAATNLSHKHIIVDVNDHGIESIRDYFDGLSSVSVCNFGQGTFSSRLESLKKLNADIAIDLNGWTGGHIQRAFYERIAPIQINYLGYYATTGNPSVDYWIGDNSLFPSDTQEFSSESLVRLNRCFIAWKPAKPLPEASLPVPLYGGFEGPLLAVLTTIANYPTRHFVHGGFSSKSSQLLPGFKN